MFSGSWSRAAFIADAHNKTSTKAHWSVFAVGDYARVLADGQTGPCIFYYLIITLNRFLNVVVPYDTIMILKAFISIY